MGSRRISIALAGVTLAGCGSTALASTNPKQLPLGDGNVTTSPKVGNVDSCMTSFGGGGAFTNGPWIDEANQTWDYTAKIAVGGDVDWPAASFKVTTGNGKRVIAFNSLPLTNTTGTFPIPSDDDAYRYDRNPNRIAAQSKRWTLPLSPTAASAPSCTAGGAIGVLTDGVTLYNALDGGGRDAAAHEVLDTCEGHPDQSSTYHHHTVPACILKTVKKGRTKLVGYAIDGYGIYVQKNQRGRLPSNAALDACHGTTSKVRFNGRKRRVYHYVATLEYPYTVGCYHGTPISTGPSGPPR